MVLNSHYTCPLFLPTLWESATLCWGVPFQTKVSQGFYGMFLPASLGSCTYLNSLQDRGRTEVAAQILDSVKEVREHLGEKTRWSESLM